MIISRKEAARRQSRELSNNSEARGRVLGAGRDRGGSGSPGKGLSRGGESSVRPAWCSGRSALRRRAQAAGSGRGGTQRSGRPEGGLGQAPSQSGPVRGVTLANLLPPRPRRSLLPRDGQPLQPLRPGAVWGRVQPPTDPPPSGQDARGRHPGSPELGAAPGACATPAAGLQEAWEARGRRE